MDGFYGPGVSNAKTETGFVYPSRPVDIGISQRKLLGDASEVVGDYVVDAAGALAALSDSKNFTPEMRAKRKIDYPKVWKIEDHLEKSQIFEVTNKMTDFNSVMTDNRGMLAGEWLTDDALAPEIREIQKKTEELDVYVESIAGSVAFSDSRAEVVEEIRLNPEMLRKRFWVFLQNNIQQTGNTKIPDFTLTVHTHDERVPGTRYFEMASEYIGGNFQDFLAQIKKLVAEPEQGKGIWWAKTDPELSDDPANKKYRFTPASTAADLLRRLSVKELPKQEIWVGCTGDVSAYPLRNTAPVDIFPSTHWWATIVDSNGGDAYAHDSFGPRNAKALTLVENINWLLAAQTPEEVKFIQDIRFSGLPLAGSIDLKNLRLPCPKQKNAYDCGIFALANIQAFIDSLTNDPNTGAHKSALLQKKWDARARRNELCGKNKPPLQVLGVHIRGNKVAAVDAKFNEHPKAYLDEAFWHLDNAGAILVSFKEINPYFNLHKPEGGNPSCKCAAKENSCQFNVLPVPQGYRVVLQSSARFIASTEGKSDGRYEESQKDLGGVAKARYKALAPEGTSKELCSRYNSALGKHPKVLVANTKGGAFIRSNSHRFQDKKSGGMTDTGILIEGCSYIMTRFGQDCLGPIPQFTYIRIMERTWVWISREPRAVGIAPAMPELQEDAATEKTPAPGAPSVSPDPEEVQGRAAPRVSLPSGIHQALQTLSEKTDIQYQRVPLGTERLTKRRRELRQLDPLNKKADSSDESIDDYMVNYVPAGGMKPRKRRNKRNRYHKEPGGQSKRLYVLSDSEQDANGHDPSGNARSKKRIRQSNNGTNFDHYASRGLVLGFQSRALVRPADSLLFAPMTKRQKTNYHAAYNENRKIRHAIIYVLRADKAREALESRIFEKGYQRILRHLKGNGSLKEGDTLSYTTTSEPDAKNLDSEDAYLNFCTALEKLLRAARKGTIIVTSKSEIPEHMLTLVINKEKYKVPRDVWLKGDEGIRKYFYALGIFKDDQTSLSYNIADAGDGKKPSENSIESLLAAPGVARNVIVYAQGLIEVQPICSVRMITECPNRLNHDIRPENNKIINLREFTDLGAFLESCAKGYPWDYKAVHIDLTRYGLSKPDAEAQDLKIFDQEAFNSLKSMRFEQDHKLTILFVTPYEQRKQSVTEDPEGRKPIEFRLFTTAKGGYKFKQGDDKDQFFTLHAHLNITYQRIFHFCGCDEKGPFWYHLGSGPLKKAPEDWHQSDSLDAIFKELKAYQKNDLPRLWICTKRVEPGKEGEPGKKVETEGKAAAAEEGAKDKTKAKEKEKQTAESKAKEVEAEKLRIERKAKLKADLEKIKAELEEMDEDAAVPEPKAAEKAKVPSVEEAAPGLAAV